MFTISIQGSWNGSVNILYICCPAFLKNIERLWKKHDTIFMNGIFQGGLLQSRQVKKGFGEESSGFFDAEKLRSLSFGLAIFLISLSVGRQ
jgi:hypothetical protein